MGSRTMQDFQTESDLRTIREAREIMKDKKRMNRVHSLLMKEKKAFEELSTGLRSRKSMGA